MVSVNLEMQGKGWTHIEGDCQGNVSLSLQCLAVEDNEILLCFMQTLTEDVTGR